MMTLTLRRGTSEDGDLSVETWANRLSVRTRARRDGLALRPSASDPTPTETERDIRTQFAAERARVSAARDQAAGQLAADLRRKAQALNTAGDISAHAGSELTQIASRFERDLMRAQSSAASRAQHLSAFQERHGLVRAAHYPASVTLALATLLVLALLEGAFSATLFATDDAMGLVGGAVKALGLGAANVAIGFASGYFGLRYLQRREWGLRLMGGVVFAGLGVLMLGLNLFAAAWRQDIARLARELTQGQIARMPHFLDLWAPEAVILLIIGVSVWLLAAIKGYRDIDDPYPDFGKLDRAAKAAESDLDDLRAEAHAALEAPVQATRARLEVDATAAADRLQELDALFDAGAARVGALDRRLRRLEDLEAGLLALYHQENSAARPDHSACPALPAGPPRTAEPDALADAGNVLAQARSAAREQSQSAAAMLERLTAELTAQMRTLDSLSSRSQTA